MSASMVFETIALSALSAFLYRLGGLSKEQAEDQIPWCPEWLINTKARDIGCSLIATFWMMAFYPQVAWYWHILAFGAMWGALTTYWDFVTGDDNFWLSGLGVSFAYLPYAIGSGDWIGFAIRCLALAVLMGAWCAIFKNDWVEESGRGAFIIATLPILLI